MTEEEILADIELSKYMYSYLKEPNKYAGVSILAQSKIYDLLTVKVQNNSTSKYVNKKNEKYTILNVRGMINYIEDFNSCLKKRDEIVKEFSRVFANAQKREVFDTHLTDPSGKSIVDAVFFTYDSGAEASIYCVNYDETLRIKQNWG